jgi:uncharacterized protein (TIRG00374 family)
MRKFIIALILMVGVMFIITRFAQLEDIVDTLQRGDWRFLLLAALVEGLWIVNMGASFKAIFRALGEFESLGRLILMATAANFVNIVAPSAGVGGIAVFISEAQNREYSAGRATVASTLFVLLDYLGFLSILTLGFVVLIRRDKLTASEIGAAVIIVLIALALAALLYLGAKSEQKLKAALTWIVQRVNAVVKPFRGKRKGPYLSKERAGTFAREIAGGVGEIRRNPQALAFPAALALNGKALMIVVLLLVFLAFQVPISVGTIIAGFCIAFLFMIVSPTPSGVGIVEGSLTLALRSFNIPLGTSAVVALAYRGFTFWLPLLFGMIAFRWVGLGEETAPQKKDITPVLDE